MLIGSAWQPGYRGWQTCAVNDDRKRSQLEKLDEIERHAQELIEQPRYIMHDGAPVLHPESGEPLRDYEPLFRGMDIAIRAAELRAQILGLYAPQRHHLVDENGNTIDITRLMPYLRRLGVVPEDE